MEEINSNSSEEPILLGLEQKGIKSTHNTIDQNRPSIIRRAQQYFFALWVMSAVGLAVGSLLHGQWAGLPWIGMVWSPLPLLSLTFVFMRRMRLPDEYVISTIDRLLQQAKQKGLGDALAKGARIVWITSKGVYTLPHRFLPWTSFVTISLEEIFFGRVRRPSLLLKFHLKTKASTPWLMYSFISLSFLLSCAGTLASYICFRQYGLRDDVLSLIFAILAALSLEGEILLRYHERHYRGKPDLEVLFDQQQLQIAELHNFLAQRLPDDVVLTVTKQMD